LEISDCAGKRLATSLVPHPIRSWLGFFAEIQNRCDDLLNGNFLHAAKIDRALAEEAGTAFDFLADDFAARASGTSEDGFCGAENGDERSAYEVGEVQGACVIGQEAAQLGEQIHQLTERGFSSEVGDIGQAI
jgi:hypothetical protein